MTKVIEIRHNNIVNHYMILTVEIHLVSWLVFPLFDVCMKLIFSLKNDQNFKCVETINSVFYSAEGRVEENGFEVAPGERRGDLGRRGRGRGE